MSNEVKMLLILIVINAILYGFVLMVGNKRK